MTTHVLRDAEVDPVVHEVLTERGGPPLAALRAVLLDAWPAERRTPALEAALDLALAFRTWQSLVRGSGLSTPDAADLAARMVCCAG